MRELAGRRRWLGLVAVAAFVAVGLAVAGFGTSSHSNKGAAKMASKTVEFNGLDVTVPPGWDSESFTNASGLTVFRAGSFQFPHRTDDDVGQIARAAMGPNDVLINIVDFTDVDSRAADPYRPVTPPLLVDASRAEGQEGYTVPAAVIDNVRIHGHKLYLSVAFGSLPPSRAQVTAANGVLRTLRP